VFWAASCSKAPTPPPKHVSQFPETELTYAPVQYDTTTFRVHFFWTGFDDDGEVKRFHLAVDDDTLRPPAQWPTTTSKDTTLLFLVDPIRELKVHVFKVAAEDNDGKIDPTPASRGFSAKTLPPRSQIESGPAFFNPVVGPNFTFQWSGIDPDGGETGGKVPVDSFQYLLLRVGGIADLNTPPTHDPLPPFQITGGSYNYVDLVNAAVGDALPAGNAADRTRHDDWKWIGIRALKLRFRNVTPGEYVFTERAVDIAGATEKDLGSGFPGAQRNFRHFTVTNRNAGPSLVVRSSILNRALDPAAGPDDFARNQLQIFQGETVSFSWIANADSYGGEIVGYTYALDDTSSFPGLDVKQTGATFQPSQLPPGNHFLYVRAVDDGGLVTNLVLPLLIVHPAFKDAGAQRSILFVDDSVLQLGNGSGPNDQIETQWWTERGPTGHGPLFDINQSFGVSNEEWDTTERGVGSVEGRKQPTPSDLAPHSTVIWTTDFQNSASIQTALFKSVAGGDYSELQGYLRAGGTLILTGWNIAQNTSGHSNDTFKSGGPAPNGICATFAPGSPEYDRTIFARMYMGVDNSVPSAEGRRSAGAFDFVRAIPTAAGAAMGFDTARVDTGNYSFGVQYPGVSGDPTPTFKWNTNAYPPPFNPDQQLFPGIGGIEGWIMATNFGCQPIQNFGVENPALPVVQRIYTYHGVREGALQDGAASPREGLVVGELVQAHDLATSGGQSRYSPNASIGRAAIFTFPLYFLRDADAIDIVTRSFGYVNLSPTLP
jgi:hypothetical protein